jgi:hypothetical protein
MNTIKIGKIIAIALAILGVIHNVATFTPIIQGGLSCLPINEFKFMLYVNLMCGSSLIISGIVLVMLLKYIENYTFLIAPTFFLGIFLLLSGVSLLIFSDNIFDNPFACIGLLLNLGMFWVTTNLFIRIKFPQKPKKWFNFLG